jgi:hypothetical protein
MEQINKNIELGQVLIRRYMIIGERRISNYWWPVISLGSFGFLLTGATSYFHRQLVLGVAQDILLSPQMVASLKGY